MQHSIGVRVFLCWIFLLFTGACATMDSIAPFNRRPAPASLHSGDILVAGSGEKIPFAALMADVSKARIVYVGESHNRSEDHGIQLKVLQALHDSTPSIEAAMEMFPRDAQPELDRWSDGMLSEEEFLKLANWEEVWGFPFALYRDLMDFVRENHVKLLGINAPGAVVRKIAREGMESLTPDERKQIARDFYFDNPEHRQYIKEMFQEHVKGHIKNFDAFYEAQLTWEETMAETLAEELSVDPDARIVVLLGKGHMNYRFGVPERVRNRLDSTYRTILPVPLDMVSLPLDPKLADYVWITDPGKPDELGKPDVPEKPAQAVQKRSKE